MKKKLCKNRWLFCGLNSFKFGSFELIIALLQFTKRSVSQNNNLLACCKAWKSWLCSRKHFVLNIMCFRATFVVCVYECLHVTKFIPLTVCLHLWFTTLFPTRYMFTPSLHFSTWFIQKTSQHKATLKGMRHLVDIVFLQAKHYLC